MKSLKSLCFLAFSFLLSETAFGASTLPERDPTPDQPEATVAEVESRRERVAVPTTAYSYFAVAGFENTDLARKAGESADGKDGDADLGFCHSAKWSRACLAGLLVYRCGQYAFPMTPYGCSLAASAFVDSIELKRIDVVVKNPETEEDETHSVPVIYTARLERLIRDRNVQMDLASLRALLVAAAKDKRRFDLWEWSWAMTNGNLEKTLENLAVLLQDTSGIAIQVQYLKRLEKAGKFDSAAKKAIADLDEVAYQLNYSILKDGDWKSWLRLYPMTKNLEGELTPLVYHFYPMAYSALKLRKAGFGNRLSAFMPFLFNTEYIAQTLDEETWPFKHPRPFTIVTKDRDLSWSMRDVYGGYAGALWGVRKTTKLPGLAKFQSDYAKRPYETMRAHFWSMGY